MSQCRRRHSATAAAAAAGDATVACGADKYRALSVSRSLHAHSVNDGLEASSTHVWRSGCWHHEYDTNIIILIIS